MARKPKAIETPGDVSPTADRADLDTIRERVAKLTNAKPTPPAPADCDMLHGARVLERRWGMVCLEGIGWITTGGA